MITCGADALDGDPLSSMALSNAAFGCAVERLAVLAPAAVVPGGGGYNPWTVARYWTGLWGRLSGRDIPATLPRQASAILRRLRCDLIDDEDVRANWLTTLADPLHNGIVRDEIRALADQGLAALDVTRWRPWMAYTLAERAPVS